VADEREGDDTAPIMCAFEGKDDDITIPGTLPILMNEQALFLTFSLFEQPLLYLGRLTKRRSKRPSN
jgi:hypothetical protein